MTTTTTHANPAILLPNQFSALFGHDEAACECGDSSVNVRDGQLGNHFPPIYQGHPAKLKDPFLPGTGLCRYTGRTVTLAAALERDGQLTEAEKRVSYKVRANPAMWLGLLDWVALEDVNKGDRLGFTTYERDADGHNWVYERRGTVVRKGATFALVDVDEDGLAGDQVRLVKKSWKGARPRRLA